MRALASDANLMTDRLSDMVRSNQEFAANASHQLRTPLTALRLCLEEAVEGPCPREEAAAALVEADRLTAVVDSLLELGERRERATDEIDIAEIARAVVTSKDTGAIAVTVRGEGRALADANRVRQVLENLVENAARFAAHEVKIAIAQSDTEVRTVVDDDGPGVPLQERALVFDRFWRGRNPRGCGSGLGLTVARELAQADGGSLTLGESDLGGARFELTLPSFRRDGDRPEHRPGRDDALAAFEASR
jgi:signal transduction histidine kinase